MDQLPNLPGVQLERKLVSIDDVSDDDDDMGTCAFLFKGAQRKRALEDMQRKKDAALADAAVAAGLEAEAAALREEEEDRVGTSSKRSRDTLGGADGAGGQSGGGASAGDALLNAEDAALLEKDRQQQARLREMQAALGSDDDEEDEDYVMSGSSGGGGPSRSTNAGGGGRGVSRRSAAAAAALTTNPNIWLRVMGEGSADDAMPLSFTRDAPLRNGIEKLATRLGLLANRVSLRCADGRPLSLDLSPREEMLADDETVVASEAMQAVQAGLNLMLRADIRGTIEVSCTAGLSQPLSALAAAWCSGQKDPSEYDPTSIVLRFDGDVLDQQRRLGSLKEELELEDGDMLDVSVPQEATCVD